MSTYIGDKKSKWAKTPEELRREAMQEQLMDDLRKAKKQKVIQELVWEGQGKCLNLRNLLAALKIMKFPDSMFDSYSFCWKHSVLKSTIYSDERY